MSEENNLNSESSPNHLPVRKMFQEEFFENGDEYYSSMIQAILQARQSIDFEVYIFKKSNLANKLLEALRRASQRDVKVRLLVDGVGSSNFFSEFEWQLGAIEAKVYHPLPWMKWSTHPEREEPQTLIGRLFFQLLGKINSRNHRKVCVIDRRTAFVGSFNVTDDHLPSEKKDLAWRDYGIRIESEWVEALNYIFEKAWRGFLRDSLTAVRHIREHKTKHYIHFFMMNSSNRLRRRNQRRLLRHMDRAKKRIWIVTPYFVPTFRQLLILERAAQRGVDVRLLLPRTNDVFFMHWVIPVFYFQLLENNVHIYEYLPSMLHAKAALIDDWCILGSSNMNSRSLFHDLEVNYILQNAQTKQKLEEVVLVDLERSQRVQSVQHYSWIGKVLGRLFLIFRHWI